MTNQFVTAEQLAHLRAAYDHYDPELRQGGAAFSQLLTWMQQPEIAGRLTTVSCKPGEIIIQEDMPGDLCYLITTGSAVVIKGDFNTPTVIGFRSAGDAIGEMALLENRPRSATVVALEATTLWVLTNELFYLYLSQNPAFSMNLMNMLSWRLRESDIERQRAIVREKQTGQLLQTMEIKANTDALTGTFNRHFMNELLPREIARARYDSAPVGIIMADIDHFKKINDTFGHKAGDLALQAVSNLLKQSVRPSDAVCRYGGEEFIMVMPGAAISTLVRCAEEIRAKCQEMVLLYDGDEIRATISMGIACYPKHGKDGEELIRNADAALYQAKEQGRNRVIVFELPEQGENDV